MSGQPTFLNTRSAVVAWKTIRKLYLEESFRQKEVARRLGVHDRTLWRWLRRNPAYAQQLEELKAKHFEREVS